MSTTIKKRMPLFNLIQPSVDVADDINSLPSRPPSSLCSLSSASRTPSPTSPLSKFKQAAKAVKAAQLLAPDDWTQQGRRRSNPNLPRRGSCSAILVHTNQRSNSVCSMVPLLDKKEKARRRSITPIRPKQNLSNLGYRFGLKESQQRALVVSWDRLKQMDGVKGEKAVIERAFTALCTKQPAISRIFVTNSFIQGISKPDEKEGTVRTLRDHARFFTWFLDKIIAGLEEDAKPMLKSIDEYGKAHSRLLAIGFTSKMWDKLGQTFVEHIVVQEAVRHYPEASKAWTQLTASIVDRLNSAFVQESKRKKTQTSSTNCI